jgi:peptide deformylase
VEAFDETGKKFSRGGSGLLAQIFQHETDHLDGILFIDHGFDFEEYTEEEVKRGMNQPR